jgi:hypothetical protein
VVIANLTFLEQKLPLLAGQNPRKHSNEKGFELTNNFEDSRVREPLNPRALNRATSSSARYRPTTAPQREAADGSLRLSARRRPVFDGLRWFSWIPGLSTQALKDGLLNGNDFTRLARLDMPRSLGFRYAPAAGYLTVCSRL